MAKYTKQQTKLSQREREELLIAFCQAIVEIKNPQEAAYFVQDLLSQQESLMLAKRLAVAKYLIEGNSYFDIQQSLKVSSGTIARVNAWLQESGEGYKIVLQRLKNSSIEEISEAMPWKKRRRRVTMYNWPQELIKEIILTSNKRQREKIIAILNKMNSKSQLYKEVNAALKDDFIK